MGLLDRLFGRSGIRNRTNTERTNTERTRQRVAAVEGLFDQQGYIIQPARSFTGLINQFSRVYSDRWDEALRNWPANAIAMENDAYFTALMDERTMPLRRWQWQIEHVDADQKKNSDAESIRKQLTSIISRTYRLNEMRDYLRDAVWYGRYGAQLKRQRINVGGFSRWVVSEHAPVHGDSLRLDWDGNWCVAINSMDMAQFGEDATTTDRMPVLRLSRSDYRQRFIVHRRRVRAGSYFYPETAGKLAGVGIRHQVYWAWWLRDEMLASAVSFLDKVGTMGLLVVYYEEGNKKSEEQAVQTAREASRRNAIAVPRSANNSTKQTAGIELIPANMGGVQFLTQFIGDYFERHIERLIVGQSLSAGTEGSGLGGTGVAGLHANTKFNLLASDAEDLDASYTSDLVQPTAELNFPDSGFEYAWKHVLPDPDADKKLAAVTQVTSQGVEFVKDEVRGLTGMRKPELGEETIGGQQPGNGMNNEPGPGEPTSSEEADQLEAIANKMESGEELSPDDQAIVDGLVNNSGDDSEEQYTRYEKIKGGKGWYAISENGKKRWVSNPPKNAENKPSSEVPDSTNSTAKPTAQERIQGAQQQTPAKSSLPPVDSALKAKVEASLGPNWKQYAEMRREGLEGDKEGQGAARSAKTLLKVVLRKFKAEDLVDLMRVHASAPKDGFGEWASVANEFLQAIAVGFDLNPGVLIDGTDKELGLAINSKLTSSAKPESKVRPGDRTKFVKRYDALREKELVYARLVLVTNGKPEQNGLYVFYNWADGATQFTDNGDGVTQPKRLCSIEDYYARSGSDDFKSELRSKLELSRSEHKKLRQAMDEFVLNEIANTADDTKGAVDNIRKYGGDAKASEYLTRVIQNMVAADGKASVNVAVEAADLEDTLEAVAKKMGVTVEALKSLQKAKE